MEGSSAVMTESRVSGLNHLTLAVSDLERSINFYRDLLGFQLKRQWIEGAYLEAGSFWLCLSLDKLVMAEPHADYTHIALGINEDAFDSMSERIREAARIWKENKSEGPSLYFLDPDGHKLELHVGSLTTRLEHYESLGK